MKCKTLFISDIHLGTDICQYEKLLDFLKSFEKKDKSGYNLEKIYLIGDIIDIINFKPNIFWSKHRTVIKKLLRMADKGVKIVYIPGNHDHVLRKDLGSIFNDNEFNNICFKPYDIYTSNNNKTYMIIHGDEFDGALRSMPWLYWLGDNAYSFALLVNKCYNKVRNLFGYDYWSLSLYLKTKVKSSISFINNYETQVINKTKLYKTDGIICGHIHKAELKYIDDVQYCNTGCFTEFCSAIIEDYEGNLVLLNDI